MSEHLEPTVAEEEPVPVESPEAAAAEPTPEAAAPGEGAAPEPAGESSSETPHSDEGDLSQRVVRRLSVGQEVQGAVRRVTEFGAFVDIGVGRDGLLHISELSVKRVDKVSDVLQKGQKVTVWIKKLDRDRNRISLTMVPPDTKTIRDLEKGDLVSGTVTRLVPYGAFLDIGIGRDALLHVREMADGYVNKPEDVVKVGDVIEVRVIEVARRRGRVDLSLKELRPAPEPEPEPKPKTAAEPAAPSQPEEEAEDPFANVEVLTPMELAFQRAMASDTDEVEGVMRKRSKRERRDQVRAIQDEIIARTLDTRSTK